MSRIVRVEPEPQIKNTPIPIRVIVKKYKDVGISDTIKKLHKSPKGYATSFRNSKALREALKAMKSSGGKGLIGNSVTGVIPVDYKFTDMMGFVEIDDGITLVAFERDENKLRQLQAVYNFYEIIDELLKKGYKEKEYFQNDNGITIVMAKNDEEVEVTLEGYKTIDIHSRNFESHEQCAQIIDTILQDKELEIVDSKFTDEIKPNREDINYSEDVEVHDHDIEEYEDHLEDEN